MTRNERDLLKSVRERVVDGEWDIDIVERGDQHIISIEDGMAFYEVDEESLELQSAFEEAYGDLFVALYEAVAAHPDRSTEQVWLIGKTITRHEEEDGEIVDKDIKAIHPSDVCSSRDTLRTARLLYEWFPEGTDGSLPSIESATTFFRLCQKADTRDEAMQAYKAVDMDDIGSYDVDAWGKAKDMDEPSVESVAETVCGVFRDRYSTEKRVEAVRQVCRMCGESPPAPEAAETAIEGE